MARVKKPPPSWLGDDAVLSVEVTGNETARTDSSTTSPSQLTQDTTDLVPASILRHPITQSSKVSALKSSSTPASRLQNGDIAQATIETSNPTSPQKVNSLAVADVITSTVSDPPHHGLQADQSTSHESPRSAPSASPTLSQRYDGLLQGLGMAQSGESINSSETEEVNATANNGDQLEEQTYYCIQCEEHYENMSEQAMKEHNDRCSEAFLDKQESPSKTTDDHAEEGKPRKHGEQRSRSISGVPSPGSEVLKGSESDLSEAPDPYESSLASDGSDPYGDELEYMPLPFIHGSYVAYPTRRESPGSEASEMDASHQTMHFPALTPADDFGLSLMDAESLSHDELYIRIENAQQAIVMWQEEWLLNDTVVRRMERTHPQDNDKNPAVPRAVKNPRQGPVRPDNKQEKAGKDENGQQGWDWKDKYKQQQQDIIEACAYGFEYNAHATKVGLQDPVSQRPGGAADGSRSLRNRMPTKKLVDNDGSESEEQEGRPRRAVRDASTASRLNSEVPEDGLKRAVFPSGKPKGRPPAASRVAQLQRQEGRSGRDSESPERFGPSRHVGKISANTAIPSTETDDDEDGLRPGTSSTMNDRLDYSDDEGKTSKRRGPVSKKKKKKPPTEKRKIVREIQLKDPSHRTEDEAKVLKSFREKKGAWATRHQKDVDAILARFDENALLTSEDEETEEEEEVPPPVSEKPKKAFKQATANVTPEAPIGDQGMPLQKEPFVSRASQNMRDRWAAKKAAAARGDFNAPHIGRRTRPKDHDGNPIQSDGTPPKTGKVRGLKTASNGASLKSGGVRTFSTLDEADQDEIDTPGESVARSTTDEAPMAFWNITDGREVFTFRLPGLKQIVDDKLREAPDLSQLSTTHLASKTDQSSNGVDCLAAPKLKHPGGRPKGSVNKVKKVKSAKDIKVELNAVDHIPELPDKKSRKGVGGRPRKHPLPELTPEEVAAKEAKKGMNKSGKPRKVRRTVESKNLSSAVVDESENDTVEEHNEPINPSEDVDEDDGHDDDNRSELRRTSTASHVEVQVSQPSAVPGAAVSSSGPPKPSARGRARKGPGRRKRATVDEDDGRPEAKRVRRPVQKIQAFGFDGANDSAVEDEGDDDDVANDADTSNFPSFASPPTTNRKRKSISTTSHIGLVAESEADVPSSTKRRKLTQPLVQPLPRKVSVYEEYQALSSPTHNPLQKRGKRTAALKARRSFNVADDEVTSAEDKEASAREASTKSSIREKSSARETSTSMAPESAVVRVIKGSVPKGKIGLIKDREIKQEPKAEGSDDVSGRGPYMSEYEHFQAIASPSGDKMLGKRRRKPVVDMHRIMELERAESGDEAE